MRHFLLGTILLLAFGGLALAQDYVGPEKCLQCHNNEVLGDATGWRTSLHANGYSYVPDDSHSMENLLGVVADADQNGVDDFKDGLDFNTISSAFDPYKPNAPILSYDAQNGYQITIGQVTHRVYMTYGGSGLYKQRYLVKINTSEGESAGYYVSPIQYNEKTHEYVLYHPDAWYDASNNPIYTPTSTLADAAGNSRNMAKGCSGCHVTGLELEQDANGEWIFHGASVDPSTEVMYTNATNIWDVDGDGDLDQINITCERCHGPGAEHAKAPTKANMINPETDLTADEANNICGMCHSRGKSKPNNTFGFPFDDENLTSWQVGDMVADLYTDGGGYWGDGKSSKQHHQQFYDFYKSIKPSNPFEPVRCFSCHDVHNTEEHHIRSEIEEEDAQENPIIISTKNDNNTLCLVCHSTHGDFAGITKLMVADYENNKDAIAAEVRKHTNHSYDPEDENGTNGASRCSKCHNPKIAKSAVAYDIHSHTFEPISPAKTLAFDMPNACAVSCHSKSDYHFGVDMSGDTFTDWSEQTDKDLAKKLLFWYENQWFEETNDDGNVVTAAKVDTPPTLDGDIDDAAWASVDFATIPLANEKSVDLKSVFTDTDLYMLIKWPDTTASFTRGGSWSYDGANWTTSAGQSEDRIALMWNMTIPEEKWQERGCMNKCHRNVDNKNAGQDSTIAEDDAFLPAGEKADMWHMKAARSLPAISATGQDLVIDPATHQVVGGTVQMVGYIDDKWVGEYDAPPDGGRHGDAGGSTYARNRNAAKDGPQYIETNPTDYMDAMVLYQSEIDNAEAVEVSSLSGTDLQAAWDKYAGFSAVVPERIIRAPQGSRADVMQAAKWENGFWYAEIKRALDTGNPDDDVIFAESNSYTFGIAVMDNAGGDGHWTQGKALTTLNIGTTGVEQIATTTAPSRFSLSQNYPNPFNPTTNIEFTIAKTGRVKIKLFTVLGEEVETLLDGEMPAGTYHMTLDASKLASGVYFYRLEANGFADTKKMILMR